MFRNILEKGRRLAGLGSLVAALTVAAPAMAQDKEPIVFGGSIPLSGVFAFAGIHLHAGLTDYTDWINSQSDKAWATSLVFNELRSRFSDIE